MAVERIGAQSIGPSVDSMSAIRGQNVQVNNSTINVVGGDQRHHAHTHIHIHYHEITDKLKAILNVVSSYRKIQQDMLAKATPGTILWLFKCKEFQLFIDVDGTLKILWGSGMPGAGKTILASVVINELERIVRESNGQLCVGYVYIRYSDQDQVNIRGILESLVKQTIERHPDCVAFAQQVYDAHIREGTRPTEDELLHLLGQFNQRKKATFYILDALDEAPPMIRLKVIQKLSSLGARLFITSRPLPALETQFPSAHRFSIAARDHDLELHINEKISDSEHLRELLENNDRAFKENVISTVKAKSDGMFLHASLQLDALQECFTTHAVAQALEAFPKSIENVYQHTWDRIIRSDRHQAALAIRVFAWVLNARQTMTIDQLQQALATCPNSYHFDSKRLPSEAIILTACRGLITVDKESKFARLVHYTAKESLNTLVLNIFSSPHTLLTAVCITRLADCGFQSTTITSQRQLQGVLAADALLEYAYGAWDYHVRKSIYLGPTASLVLPFVARCSKFPVILRMPFSKFDLLTPLHIATLCNLPVAFAGPRGIQDPNIMTARHGLSPLHLACIHGYQATVQSLLSLPDILINITDTDKMTPLMFACKDGYEGIVALFLAHPNIDINIGHIDGWSALMFASRYGHAAVVKRLVTHPDIEVNLASQRRGSTALMLASEHGHTSVVELLLVVPAINVNAVDERGNTAIKLAAEYGREDIVHMLLSFPGIDISIVGGIWKSRHTAMSIAVRQEYQGIVRLLQDFEARRAST